MLGKLLKYEIKSCVRTFIPIYAALLVFAVFSGFTLYDNITMDSFSFSTTSPIMSTISIVGYAGVLVAAFVVFFMMVVQRFSKNLLGDEGYLMFTLPVKLHTHILSKLIAAVFWYLITMTVVFSSGAITLIMVFRELDFIWESISELLYYISGYEHELILYLLELLAQSITTFMAGVLTVYAAIAIAHMFNKHRFVFGVLIYVGLGVITSTILEATGLSGTMADNFLNSLSSDSLHYWVLLSTLVQLVIACVYFLITYLVLEHKLNLD